MDARGEDPLVRVGDDVKAFLAGLEVRWQRTSPQDASLPCVAYSVLEYLLLPVAYIQDQARTTPVLENHVKPAAFTRIWNSMISDGFVSHHH